MARPAAVSRTSNPRWVWVLLLATLVLTAHAWLYRHFVVDDVFITFRYVQQWTHGHGLVYNQGERVEGYSNFLWIVLLAPFDLAGVDLLVAAKGLGLALSLGTLAVCAAWARRLPGPPVAPLVLAAAAHFAGWAVGGLETALFTGLLIAAAFWFVREEAMGDGWVSGPLFGLLALARPEGLLFAGLAVGWRAWALWRSRTLPQRRDWHRLLPLLLMVGAYFAWRLAYYGELLPNTVYAKSLGLHPRAWLEGVYYLYQSLTTTGLLFAAPLVVVLAAHKERPAEVNFLLFNLAGYGAFVLVSGGDWMPLQRFSVHVLPLAALLMQVALAQIGSAWTARRASLTRAALIGMQLGLLAMASLETRFIAGVGGASTALQDTPAIQYLQANLKPGEVLATVDAGYPAYRLPLAVRVVDMVGLTDAHIAHRPVQLPGGLFGRGDAFGKWDVDYVLAQQPKIVYVNLLAPASTGPWQTNFTGTTLLVNDPRFAAAYRHLDGPGLQHLFVRVD